MIKNFHRVIIVNLSLTYDHQRAQKQTTESLLFIKINLPLSSMIIAIGFISYSRYSIVLESFFRFAGHSYAAFDHVAAKEKLL